jgi:hypothetical protein
MALYNRLIDFIQDRFNMKRSELTHHTGTHPEVTERRIVRKNRFNQAWLNLCCRKNKILPSSLIVFGVLKGCDSDRSPFLDASKSTMIVAIILLF